MALDAIFLRHIRSEFHEKLIGGRVDKIHQPNRDEILMSIRTREKTYKILFSVRPDTARVHFTDFSPENPAQPPMLCMLLRKRLQSAKVMGVYQSGLERVMKIEFEAVNELGERVSLCIVCEIMGKYSNIILVGEDGKIIDAIKRVDAQMSSERLIFPGLLYRDPPKQDKVSVLEIQAEEILEKIENLPKMAYLNKAIMAVIQGVSPIVSREIEHVVGRGESVVSSQMTNYQKDRLLKEITALKEAYQNASGRPFMVTNNQDKPIDFSFMDIKQYANAAKVLKLESFSRLLDSFYIQRDTMERMRVKSMDLYKLLTNREERLSRKIESQLMEIKDCENREEFRMKADLINANIYAVKDRVSSIKVMNYFDEDYPEIEIELDPLLTASQNAQRYYKKYTRAKTAKIKLGEQIEIAKAEREYIESLFFSLTEAKTEQDLLEIRTELSEQGYVKAQGGKKAKAVKQLPPLEFEVSDGFKVLVGRNNKQNDTLTMKTARNSDMWFHTKNIPGSHVILQTGGVEPTDKALEDAARIAARHSKAKNSSQVPVDYTKVKNISKPQGAKPGKVIFVNYYTMYVNPQEE